jgi:hypothetical protein
MRDDEDKALRSYLSGVGDLSPFVEEAVQACRFALTVQTIRD